MAKRLIWFFVFMCVWIPACALADYYFMFEDRAWTMLYGYVSGLIGFGLADFARDMYGLRNENKQ